jgi:GNAT superfamily N-acetyltransferase
MSLEIRPVTEGQADLPIFASWLWLQWGRRRGRSPARSLARVQAMAHGRRLPFGYCAYLAGLPAGFACCVAEDLDTRPDLSPWLASVFVRPDARGQGIASAVVTAVAEEAKRRGYPELYLFTPDQESLYARLGWVELGRDRDLDEDITLMKRAL